MSVPSLLTPYSRLNRHSHANSVSPVGKYIDQGRKHPSDGGRLSVAPLYDRNNLGRAAVALIERLQWVCRPASRHFVDLEIADPDMTAACFGRKPLPSGTPASIGDKMACVVDKVAQFAAELEAPPLSRAGVRLAAILKMALGRQVADQPK